METMKIGNVNVLASGVAITIEAENLPLQIRPNTEDQLGLYLELDVENRNLVPDPEKLIRELYEIRNKNSDNISITINDEVLEPFMGRHTGQNFRLRIEVPMSHPITINAENGYLDVLEMTNSLNLTTENGLIRVRKSHGDMILNAENGPIDLNECTGNFVIKMENGPVKIALCHGTSLEVDIENGPINVKESQFTEVRLGSENGPVKIDIPGMADASYDISTENGPIQIHIQEGAPYELNAEHEIGPIALRLGSDSVVEDISSEKDGSHIHVRKGDASIRIDVRSETGMINILEGQNGGACRYEYISDGGGDHYQGDISQIAGLASTLATQISKTVSDAMSRVVNKFAEPEALHREKLNMVSEKLKMMNEKLQRAVNPDYEGRPTSSDEQNSRLKILELLESGKISPDEAEKLLKAMQFKE